MRMTPLSRLSSGRRQTSASKSSGPILRGVKKSFAAKRRQLTELSSQLTSGLLAAGAPYEDYVPVPSPEKRENKENVSLPASASELEHSNTLASQIAPTPALADVAIRITKQVHRVAAQVKAKVKEGVTLVADSMNDVASIQWHKEVRDEVVGATQAVQKAASDMFRNADEEVCVIQTPC